MLKQLVSHMHLDFNQCLFSAFRFAHQFLSLLGQQLEWPVSFQTMRMTFKETKFQLWGQLPAG